MATTRTLEEILQEQNIDIPALVKAAKLNSQLPGATFKHGAETIAQALTDNAKEIELIRRAIIHANNMTLPRS